MPLSVGGEDGEEPGARWGGGEEGGGGVWLSNRADLARALSETQAALETSEHRFMEEPFQIRTSFQVHLRFRGTNLKTRSCKIVVKLFSFRFVPRMFLMDHNIISNLERFWQVLALPHSG